MYSGIIPIIKQAAVDAVNSTQPVTILFGQVIRDDQLEIQVTPKLILKDELKHLIIPSSLTKQTVTVDAKGNTKSTEDHYHTVNGKFEVTLDNSLKKDDYVILLRLPGGTKYLVLDKAVNVDG